MNWRYPNNERDEITLFDERQMMRDQEIRNEFSKPLFDECTSGDCPYCPAKEAK